MNLDTSSGIFKWLSYIDSVYQTNPKMRESVIAKEEQNQRDFEIMQKALQMEKEARELKKKVDR